MSLRSKAVASRCATALRFWLIRSTWLFVVASIAGETTGALAASPLFPGGNRAARNDAVRRIPFHKLDQDARVKAAAVVRNTSIFRRMSSQIVDCDPRYFLFLIRHPEVIVNIWQLMDATEMSLTRVGPVTFTAEDGAGTRGNLEFLHGDHQVHVLYAEGSYTGSMSKRPIRANCLLVLTSEFVSNQNGRYYVRANLDMFLDIKNVGVELVARTFQNMIGKTTDQNFAETANFVTKLSRTTEKNGPGVQRLANRLTGINRQTRFEFAQEAGAVYHKAQSRHKTAKPVSDVVVTGAELR